jgi:hypothetical protein
MGAVFAKLLDTIVWFFQSVIMPTSRLVFYLLIIAMGIAIIANLAGILGAILFFIIFFYYVRGIIFVPPANVI